MDEFFRELDRRFQDGNLERIEGFLRETLSRLEKEGRKAGRRAESMPPYSMKWPAFSAG